MAIAIRYLLAYLLASVVGMLLFAGLSGKWDVLPYAFLLPVYFPLGNPIVYFSANVHSDPLRFAIAYSPYTIIAVLGIWTKRTVFSPCLLGCFSSISVGACGQVSKKEIQTRDTPGSLTLR